MTKHYWKVVTNCDHLERLKYSPVNPLVFTEHGALMAASILDSPRAVDVSIFIVRAFVALRRTIYGHKALARKIAQLERKLADHDDHIIALIEAIKKYSGLCRILNNAADESLRLARRVKNIEIKLTIILPTIRVFLINSQMVTTNWHYELKNHLNDFHARFRY